MIAEIGYGLLAVAFFVALYSVTAAIYGVRTKSQRLVESARRAMLLLWPLITLAAACLIYLLINNHFEVSFVYEVTSREMPTYLKVTAWWGGISRLLVVVDVGLRLAGHVAQMEPRPRISAVGHRGDVDHNGLLPGTGGVL